MLFVSFINIVLDQSCQTFFDVQTKLPPFEDDFDVIFFSNRGQLVNFRLAQHKTHKPGATRKPPATQRTVNINNCDNDDSIRTKDEQTLTGRIAAESCACENRFKNNATRLAAVAQTVTDRLRAYFQKLHNTTFNYQVTLKVLTGNKSHTVFSYTVKVPAAEQSKVKDAMRKTCKDNKVSQHVM